MGSAPPRRNQLASARALPGVPLFRCRRCPTASTGRTSSGGPHPSGCAGRGWSTSYATPRSGRPCWQWRCTRCAACRSRRDTTGSSPIGRTEPQRPGALVLPGVRRGGVPELCSLVERRPPGPPRRHRRSRRPTLGVQGLVVGADVGWLFHLREASADAPASPTSTGLRSLRLQHRCYRTVAIGVGLARSRWPSLRCGGIRGVGLLVAGFLRGAVMLQSTFCVNSLAHAHRQAGLRHRCVRPGTAS